MGIEQYTRTVCRNSIQVLLNVVAYHLDIGMVDLNNRAQFVVDLCDFMSHLADPVLNTL